MKIAVTSQNKWQITGHAGKCWKFWIYSIDEHQVQDKTLLELPKEQSFHESSPQQPHPLDQVQVFITTGIGMGLRQRLTSKGIIPVVTTEVNPDTAVKAYLEGTLKPMP